MSDDQALGLRSPWEVRRTLRFDRLEPGGAAGLKAALLAVPGVLGVVVEDARQRARVRYAVTDTDYRSLQAAAGAAGWTPADGWWERRKAGWYQNLDLTGRENAAAKPAACCNKPPVIRR